MITLTERITAEIYRNGYRVLYSELSKPWKAYAEVMGAEDDVSRFDFDSSFNIAALEQVQQMGVRISGMATERQMPRKSLGGPTKWMDDVKWAMRAHNMKFVKGIDEAQRKEMVRALQQAVDRHQTPREIAQEFLSRGLQTSAVRAERIAVTEGTRAAAMGVMLAANDFPYEMEKRWVSSGDNRVRMRPFNHNIPIEETREIHETWFNGENIMFPGDPRCSAGNVVNCRCMLALTAKRDVEGNLIPKRVIMTNRSLLSGLVAGITAAAIASILAQIFDDDE